MSYFFHYRNYLLIFVALNIQLSTNDKLTNIDETMGTDYGIVKFYNEDKGFGYIKDNDTRDELFVYDEGLIDEIYDDDAVKYKIRDTRKGLEAYDVRLRY